LLLFTKDQLFFNFLIRLFRFFLFRFPISFMMMMPQQFSSLSCCIYIYSPSCLCLIIISIPSTFLHVIFFRGFEGRNWCTSQSIQAVGVRISGNKARKFMQISLLLVEYVNWIYNSLGWIVFPKEVCLNYSLTFLHLLFTFCRKIGTKNLMRWLKLKKDISEMTEFSSSTQDDRIFKLKSKW